MWIRYIIKKTQTLVISNKKERFISAPFGPTQPTSASECCHTYSVSGTTDGLQIPSNLPALQMEPMTQ